MKPTRKRWLFIVFYILSLGTVFTLFYVLENRFIMMLLSFYMIILTAIYSYQWNKFQ